MIYIGMLVAVFVVLLIMKNVMVQKPTQFYGMDKKITHTMGGQTANTSRRKFDQRIGDHNTKPKSLTKEQEEMIKAVFTNNKLISVVIGIIIFTLFPGVFGLWITFVIIVNYLKKGYM